MNSLEDFLAKYTHEIAEPLDLAGNKHETQSASPLAAIEAVDDDNSKVPILYTL
jgi:hypothetical protein